MKPCTAIRWTRQKEGLYSCRSSNRQRGDFESFTEFLHAQIVKKKKTTKKKKKKKKPHTSKSLYRCSQGTPGSISDPLGTCGQGCFDTHVEHPCTCTCSCDPCTTAPRQITRLRRVLF
jgi:hypothetical protein